MTCNFCYEKVEHACHAKEVKKECDASCVTHHSCAKELLAEATRRARAEAFREVDEEVEKEIGGCISGSDCQWMAVRIKEKLQALKGKEV